LQETFYARAMEGDVGGRAHTGTVTEYGFEMRAGDFLGDLGERRIVFPGIWGARWPNRKGPRGGRPKRPDDSSTIASGNFFGVCNGVISRVIIRLSALAILWPASAASAVVGRKCGSWR
jgi:hypothetical protein